MHFRAWAFAGKFSGLQIDLQIVEVLDFLKIGHKFLLAFKIIMMRGVRELA